MLQDFDDFEEDAGFVMILKNRCLILMILKKMLDFDDFEADA